MWRLHSPGQLRSRHIDSDLLYKLEIPSSEDSATIGLVACSRMRMAQNMCERSVYIFSESDRFYLIATFTAFITRLKNMLARGCSQSSGSVSPRARSPVKVTCMASSRSNYDIGPPSNVCAVILGGGEFDSKRLFPLTQRRTLPAIPLCGNYRLIDIPISNCINAGLYKIYVLTQFNSTSLNRYLTRTYDFSQGIPIFGGEGFMEVVLA